MGRSCIIVIFIILCIFFTFSPSLSAQTLRGQVTNGTTGKPAAGDHIGLITLAQGMEEVSPYPSRFQRSLQFPPAGGPHLYGMYGLRPKQVPREPTIMKTRSLQTLPTSGKFGGIAFLLMLGFALSARAQTPPHYEPTLESLNQHPLPQWYADAKLGIFVHWGLYSVPGWAPRWSTPSTISEHPTTSRTIPTPSGI